FQKIPVALIAEDDESNRFYLESILTKLAIKVILVPNGKEAVNQCREHPEISLILMDLKMPVMDGFEATGAIRSFWKYVPIIAITAFAMSDDKKRALDAGCDDYLPKPVNKEDLIEKLKRYGLAL
ncbi:MAG: response regulator, partial [Bacteroidota bacterium]